MAAVRLRKAFRYPEESECEREELDEEEQERVIEELQRQNDARNAQYSVHIFLFFYIRESMLNMFPDDFYCTSTVGCYDICAFSAVSLQPG
jgi:hypothetical protein